MRRPAALALLAPVALLATLGPRAPTAHAAPAGPQERRLANGLTVLVRPAAGAREVALVVLYRVGEGHDLVAGDEIGPARCGMAHLVEHVYATAAAGDAPARDAEAWMRSRPRGANAQTGADFTVFAEVVGADEWLSALDDAAARMGDLEVVAADLDRERPRLAAELANMHGGGGPAFAGLAAVNAARQALHEARLPGHRAGGLTEDLAGATAAQVRARWARWYKPRNAVLSVAGGVETKAAFEAIEARLGALPAGEEAPPVAAPVARLPAGKARAAAPEAPVRAVGAPGGAVALAWPTNALGARADGSTDPVAVAQMVLLARCLERAADLGTGGFPSRVFAAPLDAPGAVVLWTEVREGESPRGAQTRLEAFMGARTQAPIGAADRMRFQGSLGWLLGTVPTADAGVAANPYGAAFGAGRRAMLGIDAMSLSAAMGALADEHRAAAFPVDGAVAGWWMP